MNYKEGVKDKDVLDYSSSIGKLPYIVINGVTIESKDITHFKLYNDKFLPQIEMTFKDPTNKIFDSQYPLDQQLISILISSNSDLLMPIRMDFYITNFDSVKSKGGETEENTYVLIGELNVPYYIMNSSNKGSSYDVLKTLAKQVELGFASNIEKTNDEMTWINCGIDIIREQIPEIIKRSYISDNTFTWAYVDFYYNLNYVDIEKQLKQSTKGEKTMDGTEKLSGEQKTLPLILSNHPDKNSTNLYIDKYNLLNHSTNVNFELGYEPYIYYYDILDKNLTTVKLDPISTKGNKNNLIVMKGQPKNENYALNQRKNYFLGKTDNDNAHKNYLYAEKLNEHNLEFLQKIRMSVILKNINFQLYRFQQIKIEIYKLRELDARENPITPEQIETASKNQDKYKLNERLSGDWIIIGINFAYSKKGKTPGKMVQEIIVSKRELTALGDRDSK
jgi:hypothetical protein